MRLLTMAFVSSQEFLSHQRRQAGGPALFFRSRTELATNEDVVLEVSFPGAPNRVLLRGRAVTVVPGRGAWILIHTDDNASCGFLVQLARREVGVAFVKNRSYRRFPAELPVSCSIAPRVGGGPRARLLSCTADVGAGGAFICAARPPVVGASVRLFIGPAADDSFSRVELDGQVAWTRDEDPRGFGVQFQNKSKQDARMLRKRLRRASETGRVKFPQH